MKKGILPRRAPVSYTWAVADQCPHVLGPLERSWIGMGDLAQASLHLLDRRVLPLLEPGAQARRQLAEITGASLEQHGREHDDVGADKEELDDVLDRVRAARRGEADRHPAAEDRDPAERQPQLVRC